MRGWTSGGHVQGAGDLGESYGVHGSVGDGGSSGCDCDGGRDVDTHEAGPAYAGVDVNGDGGGRPVPVAMTSFPSYDPLCSYCH